MSDPGVTYQFGRWYDAYPRLKLALSLLEWAPDRLREHAFSHLSTALTGRFGRKALSPVTLPGQQGRRWYDDTEEGAWLLEVLRHSPPLTKHQAGEQLLAVLNYA